VWVDCLVQKYLEEFGAQPPTSWYDDISRSKEFAIITAMEREIVTLHSCTKKITRKLPELETPVDEKYWDAYVVSIKKPNSIMARLIGENFSVSNSENNGI